MLVITSYFDIRSREVSDKYWLIFGLIGITIYFFDWQEHTSFDGLTIVFTLIMASLMWKFFPIGKADILALVCIVIIIPTMSEFIMVPLVVLAGGAILAGISVISYNVILNVKDGVSYKRDPFHMFDESIIRKVFALFTIHRKRDSEKFSINAEQIVKGQRKFCLGLKKAESEFAKDDVGFVECGTPTIPYMLIAFIFLIFINY